MIKVKRGRLLKRIKDWSWHETSKHIMNPLYRVLFVFID